MKEMLFATIVYKPQEFDFFFEHFLSNKKEELLIVSNDHDKNNHWNFDSNFSVIQNKSNLGFAKAANQAIDYAIKNEYRFLCLFNQDVKLNPFDMEKLLPHFQKFHELALISPFHLKNQNETEYYFNDILKKNAILAPYESESIYFVPFVHAACWVMDLTKIKQVGGFNPIFFIYGEDLNLCQRIIHNKFKIGIAPEVTILHKKMDREYDFDINKKKKAHATFLLSEALKPVAPKSIYSLIVKCFVLGVINGIKLEFKQSYLQIYAAFFLIYKSKAVKEAVKQQNKVNCFLSE